MENYEQKYNEIKVKFDILEKEFTHTWKFLNRITSGMDLDTAIDEIIISIIENNPKIDSCNFGLIIDSEHMIIHDLSNVSKKLGLDINESFTSSFFNVKIEYRKSEIYMCVAASNDIEMYYEDIYTKDLNEAEKIFYEQTGMRGLYVLPVKFRDEITGAVTFFSTGVLTLSEYEKNIIRNKVKIIAYAIEQNKLYNQLKNHTKIIEEKNKIISEDLMLARRIQKNLIPVKFPENLSVKISTMYFPMIEVGGDYFDFNFEKDNNFSVIMTDASGHGVSAAFITTMLKVAFNSENVQQNIDCPEKVLEEINKSIVDKTAGNFVTAINAYFDFKNSLAKFACAGHNPVYKINQNEFEEIHPKGRILCLFDDSTYDELSIPFKSGDRFFFYTDGLTEAVNEKNEDFEEKLISILKQSSTRNPEELCNEIENELKQHALFKEKKNFNDDIAVVVIDIN